jgi:hypothetical protein
MTKIKMGFVIALIGIACAAAGAKSDPPCWYNQQYYKVGNSYLPAGVLGVDYDCWESTSTCTYYRPNPVTQPNYYVPCLDGTYTVIPK